MRRSRISPISARRRRRDAAYPWSRKAVYDRAGGMCEANATIQCERQGWQVHHLAGRTGPDPHRLTNLLLCCGHCHRFIHDHPAIAYQRGWMVRRNGTTPERRTVGGWDV